MKPKKYIYKKPKITTQKIQLNFFLSKNRFFDSLDELLIPNVYATVTCSSSSCFVKGTYILMADNTTKEIQELKTGDLVYSYNLEKNLLVENTLEELIEHANEDSEFIIVNNNVKVTTNHKLWINKTWKEAGELKIGDMLLDSEGNDLQVETIANGKEVNFWYDLHLINNEHNYFANGILAHNKVV